MRKSSFLLAVSALAMIWAPRGTAQMGPQIQYSSGQDVQPVFEGWERNADGTFNLVFGYFNRNYKEIVDIPIGANNSFDQGGADRGQPTHFYTRRQMFVFRVVVPKDWDPSAKLTWTLTSHGKKNYAKGWLQPSWEMDNGVIAANVVFNLDVGANKPPAVSGDTTQTVTLPQAAKLTVTATDDGLPKPAPEPVGNESQRAAKRGREPGVGIKWIQYRGPGSVSFDPEEQAPVYGKPVTATTQVTFSAPGTYVLRAVASDGVLFGTHEVTVIVKPAAGGSEK